LEKGDKVRNTMMMMMMITYNHTAKDQFFNKNQKNGATYSLIVSPFL
jgi:hypothetical protein